MATNEREQARAGVNRCRGLARCALFIFFILFSSFISFSFFLLLLTAVFQLQCRLPHGSMNTHEHRCTTRPPRRAQTRPATALARMDPSRCEWVQEKSEVGPLSFPFLLFYFSSFISFYFVL